MKRNWILPLILVVLILGIGLKLAANKKKIEAAKQPVDRSMFAIPVNTVIAEHKALSATFSVPGSLEPYDQAKVMVNAPGKLASLNVELGSRVTKGQILGGLDVAQKKLELDAARLQLQKLKKDNERYKDLFEGNAASEANYDDSRFAFQSQQVKVEQIEQQLHDSQVISPISGTVVAKNIEVGEYVATNTAVVEVVDVTRLKAIVYVSERDAYRLLVGGPVTITTDIYPGEIFLGKITFVSPRGDASHNYLVEVSLENSRSSELKSGTFINATFEGTVDGKALQIPKTALAEGLRSPYVYVVQGDTSSARAYRRALVLGREVGDNVEVLDGLSPSDIVVLSGQLNLTDGSLVRVTGQRQD